MCRHQALQLMEAWSTNSSTALLWVHPGVSWVPPLSQLPHVAGRRPVVIEVVSVSDDSEEEQEDVETPDIKRRNRWRRVAEAATKQSLRCAPPMLQPVLPPFRTLNPRPSTWAPRRALLASCCEHVLDIIHSSAAAPSTMHRLKSRVRILAGAPCIQWLEAGVSLRGAWTFHTAAACACWAKHARWTLSWC